MSTEPFEAVTGPAAAFDPARVMAALALASIWEVCLEPPCVAIATGSACNVALGALAPARARLTVAAAVGEMAGPAGTFCVDLARWADPEATMAGRSAGAGAPRSRFADRPTPAVPPVDRDMDVRAGCTEGRIAGSDEYDATGLATAAGEAAMLAVVMLLAGVRDGAALGSMAGASEV